MTNTLALAQKGRKVTGELSAHGSTFRLAGEFADGTLTLATKQDDAESQITLRGSLEKDGTMTGYISGPMGDLQWTAERVRSR